jgi:hypothetical protein
VRGFVTCSLVFCKELSQSLLSIYRGAKFERKADRAIISEAHHVAVQAKKSPAKITGFGNKNLLAARVDRKHP